MQQLFFVSETDRTSSGNAQVDILLSHRGQKVAYSNIGHSNVPQEKQHSNDAVGNDKWDCCDFL